MIRVRVRRDVLGPAALVGGFYALLLIGLLGIAHHDPRDFIEIGTRFIDRGQQSAVIQVDPGYHRTLLKPGYDGQFNYYIALDLVNARYYVDAPSYRYGRILYPLLGRILALGQPGLIPWAFIAINWLAITGGTLAVAARLKAADFSGWPAIVFGLAPGMDITLRRDLADALAYALVALAIYLFYRRPSAGPHPDPPPQAGEGKREPTKGREDPPRWEGNRLYWSGIVFALAVLTRETTAVFAVTFAAAAAISFPPPLRGRVRVGGLYLAIALGPFILYKVALTFWLGGSGVGNPFEPIPFLGLADFWPWGRIQIAEVITVVIPCLIAAGLAAWALWRRQRSAETIALLINVILFVVFLTHFSYVDFAATSRIILGVVLATVAALPLLLRAGIPRGWFVAIGLLWLAPVPFLLLPSLGRMVGVA
jgi:hypothetical protein